MYFIVKQTKYIESSNTKYFQVKSGQHSPVSNKGHIYTYPFEHIIQRIGFKYKKLDKRLFSVTQKLHFYVL